MSGRNKLSAGIKIVSFFVLAAKNFEDYKINWTLQLFYPGGNLIEET